MSEIAAFDTRGTFTVRTASGSTYTFTCRRSPVGLAHISGPHGRAGQHIITGKITKGSSFTAAQRGREFTTSTVVSIDKVQAVA